MSGVEALRADFKAPGGVVSPPVDRIDAVREIETVDPDGHVICFGQPLH